MLPLGTSGNSFIFTVQNLSDHVIIKPKIIFQSCPDWVELETISSSKDSIGINKKIDMIFTFKVSNGKAGRIGSIQLALFDDNDEIITRKKIDVMTVLASNELSLSPPFPNPANPSTNIQYSIPSDGSVRIEIFNILGQLMRSFSEEEKPAGLWNVPWDGRDTNGEIVTSGVYLIKMQAEINGKRHCQMSKISIKR
jgi:hypothetical protein